MQDCFASLDSCTRSSSSKVALFYTYTAANAVSSYIIANVTCAEITKAFSSQKSDAGISHNYFNSNAACVATVADKYIGLTDSTMKQSASYPGLIWHLNIDGSHYPHLKRTPHYRDGAYTLDDRSKWAVDVWEIGQGMRLKRTTRRPPAILQICIVTELSM